MPSTDRNCGGCRYWSQMLARAGGGTTNPRGDTEAICLSADGPKAGEYTVETFACTAFAYDTSGKVDDPPDYGAEVRPIYEAQAKAVHPNGKPKFAPDGTMLDDKGNRSIFDDIDDLCEEEAKPMGKHHTTPAFSQEEIKAHAGGLTDEHREILTLATECDYKIIAATLEIPMGTVRSRLHRARAALTAAIAKSKTQEIAP